ncbi:MAG: acetylhydrolase [Dechloromonas sp.]|uniref:Acetylhydrolase n=1 Tax=Candidatus Dechloromonas phosphorivorans TaxID=2899244 RepID=A0A9D7QLL3_9RHOO|nr:acetylhydrolase [Candidatus Dechloromonas phosphorivorans]
MKFFDLLRLDVTLDGLSHLSGRRRTRKALASGVALAVLFLASARLPAQGLEMPSPDPAPAVVATAIVDADASAVIAQDFDWFDSARQRAVPVRLYLPVQTGEARTLPLVVFSHGIGGSRLGYSYLGAYWASQGYASLHLQHVGSDRSLWSGNVFSLVGRLQDAARDSEAIARVGDLRFALDQVFAHPELGDRIDATRIVAAGHSYGANTIMLAVGARVERNGSVIDLADSRIQAAILLSAPPFYGDPDVAKIVANIKVPTLHITSTEDIIRVPGYYSGAEDRIAVYEAMSGARKILAVFEGGSHSMFTDRSGTGGVAINALVKAATKELSVAFFRSLFGGSDLALRNWPQRHSDIVARFVAGGS